jgi:Helicase conserved C-terminal domain
MIRWATSRAPARPPRSRVTRFPAKTDAKKELVHRLASGTGRRILFMRTKHQARKLARQLTEAGVPSVDLHGNLSQPARDRNLAAFAAGTARVLVATDIAARGVHVDEGRAVPATSPPWYCPNNAKTRLHLCAKPGSWSARNWSPLRRTPSPSWSATSRPTRLRPPNPPAPRLPGRDAAAQPAAARAPARGVADGPHRLAAGVHRLAGDGVADGQGHDLGASAA